MDPTYHSITGRRPHGYSTLFDHRLTSLLKVGSKMWQSSFLTTVSHIKNATVIKTKRREHLAKVHTPTTDGDTELSGLE